MNQYSEPVALITETGRPPAEPPTPKKRATQRKRTDAGILRQTKKQGNILDAVRLRIQHKLPWAEVSKQTGVCKTTLQSQLSKLYDLLDVDRREVYDLARPQILSSAEEMLLLDMMDVERRKKASLNNTAYAYTQVHQARRLEAGQSTSNVGLLAAIRMADTGNAT